MTIRQINTPIGPLTLTVEDGYLTRLEFGAPATLGEGSPRDSEVLDKAIREIQLYFQGRLTEFSIPVSLKGPPFHLKVWQELKKIPYGETRTYQEIAESLGSPKAARAVGNACAANPVAIVVPCHRVLAKTGLGGFGGGLAVKKWLLRHEGVSVDDRKAT
ncbi:MAG TPA: methylated-DNA--[protein]-cysteine S-methyltransferase [Firmicutes bacterium]|nr:methylated-DNA--[protein]-cysteine S-methyltransferase [Candidatus Fermentithermobacillaceae bacterium]